MKQCRFFLMLLAIGLVYPVHAQKTQVVGLTGSIQVNSEPAGAKVYINGTDWLPDDASLIYAPLDTVGCYEKLSLTGGESGTYVDNLTFYRQPITSAK